MRGTIRPSPGWTIAILFSFLSFSIAAGEPLLLKVRFQDLAARTDLDGQEIEIKGFLYQREDGLRVLANEPGLKSCCVGSLKFREKQLLIAGDLDAPNSHFPVTLQGKAVRNMRSENPAEDALPAYRLESPIILQEKAAGSKKTWLYLVFAACASLAAAGLCLRKARRS